MNSVIKVICHFRIWIVLSLNLFFLSGCKTFNDTGFSPIEARLDSLPTGGAQHFVLVNSSGAELHHFRLRAYIWGDSALAYPGDPEDTLPEHSVPDRTYTCDASGVKWPPGKIIHFKDRYVGGEGRILRPVTKVVIVGSSDEGAFRETWQIAPSGQLVQCERPPAVQ